jgi:DNA repair ATPase RecN
MGEKIRDFKSRPAWKNRVVSVPRVIDNIQQLVAVPNEVFTAVRDLFQQLKGKIEPGTFNPEEIEGLEDLRGAFSRLGPKITGAFEKVLGVLAIILDSLVTVRQVIDDLKTIVDDVKKVREDLENLDGLFLPQNNKRKTIQSDIGPLSVRVGKLHENELAS